MTQNLNFQSQLNYKMIINRCPTVEFNVQAVDIPGIHVPAISIQTPFSRISEPGTSVIFDDLILDFIVDEQLESYNEIVNWMTGIGFPENFDQHKKLLTEGGRFSDLSIVVLSSNKEKTLSYDFKDAWPTELSPLSLKTTDTDISYLIASVKFEYSYYKISK